MLKKKNVKIWERKNESKEMSKREGGKKRVSKRVVEGEKSEEEEGEQVN